MDRLSDLFTPRQVPSDQREWWVSKTNVTDYLRCPWSFWMLDSGQLRRSTVVEEVPALEAFIGRGVEFEQEVLGAATAIPDDIELTLAEHGSATIFGLPLIHNTDLGIYGQPDGVAVESGTLAPVEVKTHLKPKRSNEVELCFYWDLLAPWRISRQRELSRLSDGSRVLTVEALPHGYLRLPDGKGGQRQERVWLSDKRFAEMRRLVSEVRSARQDPPRRRICACMICSQLFREEMEAHAHAVGDLTLISGVGRSRAVVLETAGISDIQALQFVDPEEVVTAFRAAATPVPSILEVEGWSHHAKAFVTGGPVVFGTETVLPSEYIALDLEYDSDPNTRAVYLAGTSVVTAAGTTTQSLWADLGHERDLLEGLAGVLAEHPKLAVVTWNGRSADGAQLKKACLAARNPNLWHTFESRHIDLYQALLRTVRFPSRGFDLKSIAGHLGVAVGTKVLSGVDTVRLWQQYCRSPGSRQVARIRRDLTKYNAADVEMLVRITDTARQLVAS